MKNQDKEKLTQIKNQFYSNSSISIIPQLESFINIYLKDKKEIELYLGRLKLLEKLIIEQNLDYAKIEFDDCLLQLIASLEN
jgi:hypothetical protein